MFLRICLLISVLVLGACAHKGKEGCTDGSCQKKELESCCKKASKDCKDGSCARKTCTHGDKCDKKSCDKNMSQAEFGGHCPMGLTQKKKLPGRPDIALDYKGKRYHFSSKKARDQFSKNIDKNLIQAHEQWGVSGAGNIR